MTLHPSDLAQFTGSETAYRHWMGRLVYTEGVKYLAEKGGAYWLIDAIASYQPDKRIASCPELIDFQLWELAVGEDKSATLTALFLSAVSPAKIEIALQALDELEAQHQETRRQWDLQLQQAEYEIELARRRYESTDPENRLVAAELEAHWEEALHQRERLQQDRAAFERREGRAVGDEDRRLIRELSHDLKRVWNAETTSMEERKTLLRLLVKRVHLDGVSEAGKIRIDVEWHTGAHSSVKIDRLPVGVWAPKTPVKALQRIRGLLPNHDYAQIAKTLNQEGFQSAKGLPYDDKIVGYIVWSRG